MFLPKMMKTPILLFTIFILINGGVVISAEDLVPSDASALGQWFNSNVKPFNAVKASLDPKLAEAEAGSRVIKVRQDGSGEFKTINDAIKSIPSGNTKRVILWLGGGEYKEKITIDRTKPFITFYASSNAVPNITYGGTAQQYGTVDSATLIVESDYFVAVNLIIANSSPRPDGKRTGAQASAMRISGDKAAFYNCKMLGFQDTLCDDRGNHFFKDCFIEGTVDFIFGSGKSMYLNTELHVVGDTGMTAIAAHARDNKAENSGYSFVHCKITGSGNGTYLGRAWKSSPSVVYAYTVMQPVINPEGWSVNFHPERASTVQFGEYKCSGPGATSGGRAKFVKQLSDEEVKPFLSLSYVEGSKWLLPPPSL